MLHRTKQKTTVRHRGLSSSLSVAALVVVGIVVGVAFIMMNATSTTLVATSQTTPVTSECQTTYNPPLQNASAGHGSFYVFATNSTAEVCLQVPILGYAGGPGGNASWPSGHQTWLQMVKNGGLVDPVNITVTPDPPGISVRPNSTGYWAFDIAPVSGTRAIYYVGLPDPCWSGYSYVILAVGYSPSYLQRTISGSSLPNVSTSCTLNDGDVVLVGTTSLQRVTVA